MEISNVEFVEEYKRVDKILLDAYPGERGITDYINRMRNLPDYSRCIPGWGADLRMLIKLRDSKNRLSHDVGTFSIQMCTEHEFVWLQDFHARVLRAEDPLSVLSKIRKAAHNRSNLPETHQQKPQPVPVQKPECVNTAANECVKSVKRCRNMVLLSIIWVEIILILAVIVFLFIRMA